MRIDKQLQIHLFLVILQKDIDRLVEWLKIEEEEINNHLIPEYTLCNLKAETELLKKTKKEAQDLLESLKEVDND